MVKPRLILAAVLGVGLILAAATAERRVGLEGRYLNRTASEWVNDLNSTNATVRAQSVAALKVLGPQAVPALVRILRTRQSRIAKIFFPSWQNTSWFAFSRLNQARMQLRAAKALREIGPGAAPAVFELFKDRDATVQQAAVETLSAMGTTVLPMVLKSVAHPDRNVRFCSAITLGRLGAEAAPAVPALIQGLKDPDPKVRSAMANALGDIGPGACMAAPELTRSLRDAESTVRMSALRAIDRIGPGASFAVPMLAQMLGRKDEPLRSELIHALGRIGPEARPALDLLQLGLHDPDIQIRLEAARSVWRVQEKGDESVLVLMNLLEGNGLVVRCRSIEVLGEMGSAATNAVPALLVFLNSNPPHDDRYAAAALTRIAPEVAANALKDRPNLWRRP